MRTLSLAVLAGVMLAIGGCGDTKTAAEKEFEKLYRQYSNVYHEKMVVEAERMTPAQVTAEAGRMWDETFSGHKDLLLKRCEEILADLPTAPTINEDLYFEVISGTRNEAEKDPEGTIVKQFVWNPLGAASMALNNTLRRLLNPQSFAARSVLIGNASLFWEAIDRDANKPKLMQRQGPLVFIIELSRKDDYYRVDKIRWLRPKSMGPLQVQKPPAEGTPGTETPGTETPGATTPGATTPGTTEKPPAEKKPPAGTEAPKG